MPKKNNRMNNGRGRTTKPEDSPFFGHDDRIVRDWDRPDGYRNKRLGSSKPRVSFKNQVPSIHKINWMTVAKHSDSVRKILDDDVDIRQDAGHLLKQRHVGRGSYRGSTTWHSVGKNSHTHRPNNATTFKVTIPFGHKYEKDFIINSLLSCMEPTKFVPIMYKTSQHAATFFVDDANVAESLRRCDKTITTADGFRIGVRTMRQDIGRIVVDEEMKTAMKQAMAKRYVEQTNALDLTRFHLDSDLVDKYYCDMTRAHIIETVLDIVAEAIPNLHALNLDNNHLRTLNKLNPAKLPALKILYVGDNKIAAKEELKKIKNFKLEELRLAGNPLRESYAEHQDYIEDIRKIFPRLLRLDGEELPRPIVFDVADVATKPPPETQRAFILNPVAKEVANTFLREFFAVYDGGDRQPLLAAYHEQAVFSLTAWQTGQNAKLNSYLPDNRNLKRVCESGRRRKLLKQGRLQVVSFICSLPKTQHDVNSFTMDISLVTDSMMSITIEGMFKEIGTSDQPIRYFSRTFIIVPVGSGYCIQNEMLHISQPTAQQEAYMRSAPKMPIPIALPPSATATASTSVEMTNNDDVRRQQLTVALCERTKMNLTWSYKCLDECKWDFDRAVAAFLESHKNGQIPQEAFT